MTDQPLRPTDVHVTRPHPVRLTLSIGLVDDLALGYFRQENWPNHGIVTLRMESGDLAFHVTSLQLSCLIEQLTVAQAAMFGPR
jgi:hypothetical protein